MTDAIDVVLSLRTGDHFRLRGRKFVVEGYQGCSNYGDYWLVPVWNERNQKRKIRVRPEDHIEILPIEILS